MDTINIRICYLIRNLGITKTAFAEKIHVTPQFVSSLCSGVKIPSDRTIMDICREFNVSEVWLREGTGDMFVTRTMNQELAIMVNELMSEADDSFRKRFVSALLDLPPQLWPELEKFIKKISQDE